MNEKKPVVVRIVREGDSAQVFCTGAKSLPEIRCDFSSLSREEADSDHLGARLLLCAALACYTNTFANLLAAGGARIRSLSGSATIRKEKDEVLRTRYTEVKLEVRVDVDEKDAPIFERVKENMERGSLLTYSLGEGIEMEYDIRRVVANPTTTGHRQGSR